MCHFIIFLNTLKDSSYSLSFANTNSDCDLFLFLVILYLAKGSEWIHKKRCSEKMDQTYLCYRYQKFVRSSRLLQKVCGKIFHP